MLFFLSGSGLWGWVAPETKEERGRDRERKKGKEGEVMPRVQGELRRPISMAAEEAVRRYAVVGSIA